MKVNFSIARGSYGHMTLEPASLPAVPAKLISWLTQVEDLDPAGRLLE